MSGTTWIRLGAILGGLGVIAGAFGAHGLEGKLDSRGFEVFETAAARSAAPVRPAGPTGDTLPGADAGADPTYAEGGQWTRECGLAPPHRAGSLRRSPMATLGVFRHDRPSRLRKRSAPPSPSTASQYPVPDAIRAELTGTEFHAWTCSENRAPSLSSEPGWPPASL